MTLSPSRSSLGFHWLRTAPLSALAGMMILVGGLIAAPAVPTPLPLTPESLQALVNDHKVSPDQAKILQADLDYIASTEKKLADFRSQTPPAQLKLKPNSLKYTSLQRELEVGQHKLAKDQINFTSPPAQPTLTPKPKH